MFYLTFVFHDDNFGKNTSELSCRTCSNWDLPVYLQIPVKHFFLKIIRKLPLTVLKFADFVNVVSARFMLSKILCIFFRFHLFIWKTEWQSKTGGDRDGDCLPLAHAPDGCHGEGWTSPKPVARNSILISHVGGGTN